jgi:hypothetical protein
MSHSSKYECKYCSKEYSTSQSRSNHYRIYHKNDVVQIVQPVVNNVVEIIPHVINNNVDVSLTCKYCNKILCDRFSRWKHEKKCNINKIEKLEEENLQIKQEVKLQNIKIEQLETIVNNLSKKDKSIINNLTVHGDMNTNTVNNINSLGYENILSKLSEKDKIHLLTGFRHDEYPIIELVRKIYTNDDFKNERNTLLTNLQNKSCLIYKSDNNKFEATNKNKHIDNIIKNRKNDITTIYNQFNDTSKLKSKERKAIEDYLENIEQIDKKDKNLKALYEKHKEEIIYIIYNCKEFMGTIRDNLGSIEDDDDHTE